MISILLGPDDFSKREYIAALAQEKKLKVELFTDAEEVPPISSLLGTDLFSKSPLYVLVNLSSGVLTEDVIAQLQASPNYIFFIEDRLDKRTNIYKILSKQNDLVREFPLPHGKQLDAWIQKRLKELGGSMDAKALDMFARLLGRDDAQETKFGGKVVEVHEVFTLWQADSELRKLVALADGKPITTHQVMELISQNREVDTLDIVNAIGEGNKAHVFSLVDSFLSNEPSSDEKSKIIQLNALLADQFRSIAITQGLAGEGKREDDMLAITGWKSGRLFIMKKIAARFNPKKIQEAMIKLEALDEELKTSNTPPRVLLDMILVQLFM